MAKAKECPKFISADCIARYVGRPTPWVESRILDLKIEAGMVIDGTTYFDAEAADLIRQESDDWQDRVSRAKREAAKVG